MIVVSSEEIISQKVLPYDLYDETGAKILEAGEILTPGKILLVRNHEVLYKKEEKSKPEDKQPLSEAKSESNAQNVENIKKYGPLNKKSKIDFETQIELKSHYMNALSVFNQNDVSRAKAMILEIRDKIIKDSQLIKKNVQFFSELKLLGEHKNTHPLNTAIFSVFLANKLEYNEVQIMEIALSALLHDIGKIKLTGEITDISKMTKDEEAAYRKHPLVGHRLIKTELKLSENIARVALQHHERMDGTGWPYGISSTMISEYAQIIAVCNHFDNMTSSATNLEISNFREALRALLKAGSRAFSPKPLYAFVHMLSYGDTTSFEELKF
ncbi:TPA: HD domain-containing protein [Candidatus Galligastranaerophilus faecipullorum]|nr:HD domain-containing protein [Candidatus Galligastranaerophilus faecipullorum]